MPNYSLVIDSKFEPFSFERYIQPYQIYGTAYREQEEALAELGDKAGEIAGKINPNIDIDTYNRYKSYADALKMQSDEIATRGLNPLSRKAMLSLRNRYNKEITPINVAWERRRQLADEQRVLRNSNSTVRFDNDFSTMSLDNLINNPEINYSSLSGQDITERTAAMADQLAKTILSKPEYEYILGNQYIQQKLQAGVSLEDILREIDDNAGRETNGEISKAIRTIRDTIRAEISNNPAYDQTWADSYINRGLYHALNTTKYDLVSNKNYVDANTRYSVSNHNNKGDKGLIPMDNGNFYDPNLGVIRNSDGVIISNPTGGVSKNVAGGNTSDGYVKFKPLYYQSKHLNALKESKFRKFNVKDPDLKKLSIIEVCDLPGAQKLMADLADSNLTLQDVDVYKDPDWFLGADEYKVVLKDHDPRTEEFSQEIHDARIKREKKEAEDTLTEDMFK